MTDAKRQAHREATERWAAKNRVSVLWHNANWKRERRGRESLPWPVAPGEPSDEELDRRALAMLESEETKR